VRGQVEKKDKTNLTVLEAEKGAKGRWQLGGRFPRTWEERNSPPWAPYQPEKKGLGQAGDER